MNKSNKKTYTTHNNNKNNNDIKREHYVRQYSEVFVVSSLTEKRIHRMDIMRLTVALPVWDVRCVRLENKKITLLEW